MSVSATSAPVAGGKSITLVNVHIPGYIHAAAYDDLICSVRHGLIALGYEVQEADWCAPGTDPAIVFGGHLIAAAKSAWPHTTSVIYNTEHIASAAMSNDYLSFLMRHEVWDYSADNAAALSTLLGKPVRHVPFGYVPELTRITPAPEQDIDVLFYGSMNERRRKVLDELMAAGLNVVHVFGVYGAERDDLIAGAKVVLNMHYYMPGHFETLRVGYLLANRKAVVSEMNPGETIDLELAGDIHAEPYDDLVQVVSELVADAPHRRMTAEAGFRAFKKMDEPTILREAIAATWGEVGTASAAVDTSPPPFGTIDMSNFIVKTGTYDIAFNMPAVSGTINVAGVITNTQSIPAVAVNPKPIPTHLIVGSGKSYDPTALNLDIDPRWKPDVVADISHDMLVMRIPAPLPEAKRSWLRRGAFTKITASHVLEHIPDLVQAMTNCLDLLANGGEMHITVPYDLSYGAWQDPTHVRAFNERSWLYYTDWWWYLGWETHRFDLVSLVFWSLDNGQRQPPTQMTPRAVDEMRVVLRKRPLTEAEKAEGVARHNR